MSTVSAVKRVQFPLPSEEMESPDEKVHAERFAVSEQARYRPRFRVVARKPLPTAQPVRVSPVHRASLLAALPALCLLVYVLCWTLAMRGGYYRDQLRGQIDELMIQQRELQAEKRRLQSPGYILQRAEQDLGMREPEDRLFHKLPSTERIAQRVGER